MWIVFLVFPCFTNLKLHKHWIWICGRQRQLTYLLIIHVFPVQLCWKTSRTKGELNEKATRGHHDKNGCIGSRIYEEQTTGDDILKSFIVQKFLLKNEIQILSNIEEALKIWKKCMFFLFNFFHWLKKYILDIYLWWLPFPVVNVVLYICLYIGYILGYIGILYLRYIFNGIFRSCF